MATHCSIFAWRILWTEGPDGLQSMELQSRACLSTCICTLPWFFRAVWMSVDGACTLSVVNPRDLTVR